MLLKNRKTQLHLLKEQVRFFIGKFCRNIHLTNFNYIRCSKNLSMASFETPKTASSQYEKSQVLSALLKQKTFVSEEDTALIFFDLAHLEKKVIALKTAFPTSAHHAAAMKANPLIKINELLRAMDLGIEVASLPELQIALSCGFQADKIIFDSPAKTKAEIAFALQQGVHLNADSFDELDRIHDFLKSHPSKSSVGIRVNPQIGEGKIASTGVASKVSKFAVPLQENRERLIKYFTKHHWINAIHVHIGSQGYPVPQLVKGIQRVFNFIEEVNREIEKAALRDPITLFDLGGGLPVPYHPNDEGISFGQYRALLEAAIPKLFQGHYRIITEFGRALHAQAGWVASKVEYVKHQEDQSIVILHVGADLLLRECYNPNDWHHEITVADHEGHLKEGPDDFIYTLAGPLCFAGDIIARHIRLPKVDEGDYILIHDTGAYSLGMWSRYNSRQMPKVIGYRADLMSFEVLKERESVQDLIRFWQ